MTNIFFRILCKNMGFGLLEYIGTNAMNIYVIHWILMASVIFLAKYFFDINSKVILLLLLIGACALLLPIINEITEPALKS